MQALMLHNSCDLGPIKAVLAQINATKTGFAAQFCLEGALDQIGLPMPRLPKRHDELWKSTCFEVFWQPIGETHYREFNFSPCGRWAAYEFDEYRKGMRDAPLEAISLSLSPESERLTLKVDITIDLSVPAQIGLSAVIDQGQSPLQYWALAFAPGKPDFHSEACRQLILDRD